MLKAIFRVGIVTVGVVGLASAQQPVPPTPTDPRPLPATPQPVNPQPVDPQPVPQPGTAAPGSLNPNPPATDMVPTPYRAKEILGTRVTLQPGTPGATGTTVVRPDATGTAVARVEAVGTVDDIVFSDDGMIEYLIVENAGKLVTVPWQAAKFDMKQKTAALAITTEQYRLIPTYTVRTYPSFYTPAYRTETYRFYGLTPAQMRRTERRR